MPDANHPNDQLLAIDCEQDSIVADAVPIVFVRVGQLLNATSQWVNSQVVQRIQNPPPNLIVQLSDFSFRCPVDAYYVRHEQIVQIVRN